MTLITGSERRRRWSDEERARILAEIAEPNAVVAEVARRADVCTSLVYRWWREARKAAQGTVNLSKRWTRDGRRLASV
jgi:transposase